MFEPCFEHCYLRFGKQYTPDCDDKCEYAKTVKERNKAIEEINSMKGRINFMTNTESLGKVFTEKLKKEANNFNNWVAASTAILNAKNNLNEVDRDDIVSVDTFEIDLAKVGIDVGQWEEPIKPVKIIMSIVRKNTGNFNFSVEFGNMVLLMEDGTFKISA